MQKTLILIDSLFRQYGLDGKEHNNILFLPMMRGNIDNKFVRAIRKLHLSSELPGKKIWLDTWQGSIEIFDTVILADTGNSFNVARYIHKQWPSKRIIIWYRNSVSAAMITTDDFDRSYCELWSFDKADCNKFYMKYNPQFYMKNMNYSKSKIVQDAFFVGQDKGRLFILKDIEKGLKAAGYRTKFCIVGVNSKRMTYGQILDEISKSNVIVDVQSEGQSGITLRPMEALFYNKKLITNSPEIKQLDFYNANNVFVWGEDPMEKLNDFLISEYDMESCKYMYKYGLEGWVDRFFQI